jgi:hypothetical protein
VQVFEARHALACELHEHVSRRRRPLCGRDQQRNGPIHNAAGNERDLGQRCLVCEVQVVDSDEKAAGGYFVRARQHRVEQILR